MIRQRIRQRLAKKWQEHRKDLIKQWYLFLKMENYEIIKKHQAQILAYLLIYIFLIINDLSLPLNNMS